MIGGHISLSRPGGWLLLGCLLTVCASGQTQNPYYSTFANRFVNEAMARSDAQNQASGLAHNIFWLSWGYASPNSQRQNDPAILPHCISLWDYITAQYNSDAKFPEGGPWSYVPFLESLRYLEPVAAIPAAKKTAWKAALKIRTEAQYNAYGDFSKSAQTGAGDYPNWDAQTMVMFHLAHLVYGDPKYKTKAKEFLDKLGRHLQPGGGFSYFRGSTPVPLYHGFELIYLGRYLQLSGEAGARDLIRRTVDYYPYTWTPEDAVEYSSAPWWKQMWNPTGGAYHGVEMAAWVTRDGRSRWLADRHVKFAVPYYWTVYCAEVWDGTVQPTPLPDRFIVADANVGGVRGRFGKFSWVGSRGKNTMSFAGCMVADAALPQGYDGYLQLAHLGVEVPGAHGAYYQTTRMIADPSVPTVGASAVGQDHAAQAVSYVPRLQTSPVTTYDDWQVVHLWLYTPDSVVGWIGATALKDGVTTLPVGILRLGPFARPWAYKDGVFNVGNLQGRILQHNFALIVMREGEGDENHTDKRREIRLQANAGPFAKDHKFNYAVQFTPGTHPAAATVTKRPGDTQLIDVQIGTRGYRLDYDPRAGTLHVTTNPSGANAATLPAVPLGTPRIESGSPVNR